MNTVRTRAVWLCAGLYVGLLACAPELVAAQSGNALRDWQTPSLRCEPACRSGYECRRGECLPICSPACGDGFVCSAGGSCVRAEPEATAPVWSEPSAPDSCTPGCRSGFTCLSGRCVSLCNPICSVGERCTAAGECVDDRVAVEPSRPEPPPDERDASADSIVNLHLDVLGALQFGLTPAVEVGQTVSGYLRLRVLNTGLASYFLVGRDREDDLRWGAGAALGLHVFSAERGNMRGFYGGAALEYVYYETRDTVRDFATYGTHALIPQVDFGYRWAFGGLLVGISGHVGLAIPFSDRARGYGDNGCRREESCVSDYGVAVIPGIAVDLGWFIPAAGE